MPASRPKHPGIQAAATSSACASGRWRTFRSAASVSRRPGYGTRVRLAGRRRTLTSSTLHLMSEPAENSDGTVRNLRPWKPGQSGRPGGRPKGVAKAVREVCGGSPLHLAHGLLEIAEDPKVRPRDRIAAYSELLDRGWGKASAFATSKQVTRSNWTRWPQRSGRSQSSSGPGKPRPSERNPDSDKDPPQWQGSTRARLRDRRHALEPQQPARRHRRYVHPPRGRGAFVEDVCGDDPELASYVRIEERELEAGGLNLASARAQVEDPRAHSTVTSRTPASDV